MSREVMQPLPLGHNPRRLAVLTLGMGERRRGYRCSVGVFCLLVAAMVAAPAAALAAGPLRGELDRSFGRGGRALYPLGDAFARSSFGVMVRQPDGGILLGGDTEIVGSKYRRHVGFIERRDPSGALDASFGGGMVQVRELDGLALQDDGRVLAAVQDKEDLCGSSASVHRLQSNGTADPSFGKDGVGASVPLSIASMAVDAEGRIVVAGSAHTNPCGHDPSPRYQLALARLLPNGALDPSFGTEGIVRVLKDNEFEGNLADGLTIREDGSILIATGHALVAFTAAGALDPSFGNAGIVELSGRAGALLGLPGGKTLVASSSSHGLCCSDPGHFVISRYLINGSLDPGFSGGSVSLTVGAVDRPTALAAGPGGSVLLGGEAAASSDCPAGECDFAPLLARFTAAGAIDSSFGQAGQATLKLPGRTLGRPDYAQYAAALAVAPNGQILAAGGAGDGGDATVSALQPNGAPDPAFGLGGTAADVRTLPAVTEAFGLAIGSSGDIFTSAWSDTGSHYPRAILIGAKPDGAVNPEVGSGVGFVVPETNIELRADGHNRFYSVSTASSLDGAAYVARFDDRGQRDLGYGSQGRGEIPAHFDIESLVVRPSGEALVVGQVNKRFGMAAFELGPDGEPDRRFGHDGLALVGFGPKVKAMALSATFDPRGRVVLFGNDGPYSGMARLLPNGRPDPGFAYHGRQPYMPGLADEESAVAMASDGGIFVAAAPEGGVNPLPTTLIRLRSDGIRDRAFGHNGVVRVDAHAPMVSFFGGRRPILVSAAERFGERGVVIRAFKPDGSMDRSFGHRGAVTAAASKAHPFRPAAAARQRDGRLVVAGATGGIEEVGSPVELLRFR